MSSGDRHLLGAQRQNRTHASGDACLPTDQADQDMKGDMALSPSYRCAENTRTCGLSRRTTNVTTCIPKIWGSYGFSFIVSRQSRGEVHIFPLGFSSSNDTLFHHSYGVLWGLARGWISRGKKGKLAAGLTCSLESPTLCTTDHVRSVGELAVSRATARRGWEWCGVQVGSLVSWRVEAASPQLCLHSGLEEGRS